MTNILKITFLPRPKTEVKLLSSNSISIVCMVSRLNPLLDASTSRAFFKIQLYKKYFQSYNNIQIYNRQ